MHELTMAGRKSGCGGSCGPIATVPGESITQLIRIDLPTTPTRARPGRPQPDKRSFRPTEKYTEGLIVGFDVGSTTVKAVVVDPATDEILWKDYQRHETKQPEKCLEFFHRIESHFKDVPRRAMRVFMTGSGASGLAPRVGGRFVQEVNAVSLAVEKLHPDVQSVVELGGQDAKIIVFKEDPASGKKKKIPTMNDKCAGGTGAVIDKINAKLKIPADQLCEMTYVGHKLHPVAGKCGVFAETDINGLQKTGVPPNELMASLFESIIQQNLSVLTRGHTLRPKVLLLGGPNTFIKGMVECWRSNIPQIWKERKVPLPDGIPPEELIIVPDNAQYYAAIGAVEFAKIEIEDDADTAVYGGTDDLAWYVDHGRLEEKLRSGGRGLSESADDLEAFKQRYRKTPWEPARFDRGTRVQAFMGIDGGSTSTKGVLLDTDKRVIAKAYQLSKGNPIEDTMDIVARLQQQIEDQGCTLDILGVGTTGYAKDTLKDVIAADTALVETVAHTEACLHFYPGTDVIVDVGGQDIKLIILKNGQVKDFKLNTQCSAGNGYFLQSTAQSFGFEVEDYADIAFGAEAMPEFGYGCAVFMQSDIVDFQRQGWKPAEIMAGLAAVLPKNIWLYVSQIPNLAKLGRRFVLQGGTQHNLAAVKSQVDFIESRFAGTGEAAEVIVHQHCGESGAIGCGLEAHRRWAEQGRRTTFIGLDRMRTIRYRTTRDENTRCYFCKNKCLRTFIDVQMAPADEGAGPAAVHGTSQPAATTPTIDLHAHRIRIGPEEPAATRMKREPRADESRPPKPTSKSKVPLAPGEQRLIIATCEKGTVEDVNDMRQIKAGLDAVKKENPNFMEIQARDAFKATDAARVADPIPKITPWTRLNRKSVERRAARMARREQYRIGLPRLLNMYSTAPFFLAYFESLGIPSRNFVWSDYTSEELYKDGAKRAAIDPCFPSKIGIPHVHNLLYRKHTEAAPLDAIFFPMIDALTSRMENCQDHRACPTVTTTPAAVKAAFVKEGDLFAEMGVTYIDPLVDLSQPLLTARVLAQAFGDEIGVTEEESRRAVQVGLEALAAYEAKLRRRGREVLDRLEAEDRLGIVVLARPYHNDPGVSHLIAEELQKLGYPVFTQDALPMDDDILDRLFGEEVRRGDFVSPLSVEDAWKNSYSENTTRKIWAAKYTARHPNLVALELSSFKCGHDAPIYTVIEEIIEKSGTPYFCFKDIDENKPAGSIKIRIETIAYFLSRYRERLVARRRKLREIDERVCAFETNLRSEYQMNDRTTTVLVP